MVLLLLAVAVGQAEWLPIYPDEVANRISLERHLINGGYKQSVWAMCPNFLVRTPISLIPASLAWALLDGLGVGFWSYRLAPIVCIAFIVAILLRLKRNNRPLPFLLVMTFGPILYGLVIFRSEAFTLAACVAHFYLLILLNDTRSPWLKIFWLVLVVFAFSVVAVAHPKALYIFPLTAICIIFGAYGFDRIYKSALVAVFFGAAGLLIAVQAVRLHLVLLYSCGQIPKLAVYYQHQAVNVFDAIGNRSQLLADLGSAFGYTQFQKLVEHLTYQNKYDINYLPPMHVDLFERFTNALLLTALAATLLYTVARIAMGLLLPGTLQNRVCHTFLGVAIAIFAFIFITNLNKNFYDCSMFVGSFACIAALAETLPVTFSSAPRLRRVGFMILAGAIASGSLLSTYVNLRHFTSKMAVGYMGASGFVSKTQATLAVRLDALMKRHNIPEDAPIVVDDQTYGILRKHRLTLPITYMLVSDGSLFTVATKDQHAEYGAFYCSYLDGLKGIVEFDVLGQIKLRDGDIPTCLVTFAAARRP